MNDIFIVNDNDRVVYTEQWNGDLFLTIADGEGEAYEAKSILLDTAQVRKLAEWLSVWVLRQEDAHGA